MGGPTRGSPLGGNRERRHGRPPTARRPGADHVDGATPRPRPGPAVRGRTGGRTVRLVAAHAPVPAHRTSRRACSKTTWSTPCRSGRWAGWPQGAPFEPASRERSGSGTPSRRLTSNTISATLVHPCASRSPARPASWARTWCRSSRRAVTKWCGCSVAAPRARAPRPGTRRRVRSTRLRSAPSTRSCTWLAPASPTSAGLPRTSDQITSSRVGPTRALCEWLASRQPRPRVLVCASATGFYGNRDAETVDESSPPGTGFLPEVCVSWERAAEAARDAGIRVVHLRTGIVLSPKGGALKKMLPRVPRRPGGTDRAGHAVHVLGVDRRSGRRCLPRADHAEPRGAGKRHRTVSRHERRVLPGARPRPAPARRVPRAGAGGTCALRRDGPGTAPRGAARGAEGAARDRLRVSSREPRRRPAASARTVRALPRCGARRRGGAGTGCTQPTPWSSSVPALRGWPAPGPCTPPGCPRSCWRPRTAWVDVSAPTSWRASGSTAASRCSSRPIPKPARCSTRGARPPPLHARRARSRRGALPQLVAPVSRAPRRTRGHPRPGRHHRRQAEGAVAAAAGPRAVAGGDLRCARAHHRRRTGGRSGSPHVIVERFFRPFLGGIFLDPTPVDVQPDAVLRLSHAVGGRHGRARRGAWAPFPTSWPRAAVGSTSGPDARVDGTQAARRPRHRCRAGHGGDGARPRGRRRDRRRAGVGAHGHDASCATARAVSCVYFDAPASPVGEPILVLDGDGRGPVMNLAVHERRRARLRSGRPAT